jgi:hypothetical protein
MAGTVTVACKIPNGLMLQVFVSTDAEEPVMGGGSRKIKQAHVAQRVRINGPAVPEGRGSPYPIFYDYALTHGVDADLFAKWLEQNKDSDFVTKGFVKAAAKAFDLEVFAKEHADAKTGLERLNRKDLPPEFRQKIEPATTKP